MLDEDYRPIGEPDAEPMPPRFPGRVRYFIYGCAEQAFREDLKLAGGKVQKRRAKPGTLADRQRGR